LIDLQGPVIDPLPAAAQPWSMWRYRLALPAADDDLSWEKVTLGEGMTPLLPIRPGMWCKCDYVTPTGSFKDRGTAVMLSVALAAGAHRLVADSSGNAGRSIAAYAARAGIQARVFVPAGTEPAKVAAIEAYGAAVTIGGNREEAASAALAAAAGSWYASHVYRPAFVHGVKTLAFELYEQLGHTVPGAVVVPAGNGTLVLGLWLGFRQLQAAGRLAAVPPIVAAQAERCAPLLGWPPAGPTKAVGIAIARPPRLRAARAAVLASGGSVVAVAEEEIEQAVGELTRNGVRVEPTGAVGWAACMAGHARRYSLRGPVVAVLTGAG
jgi:threonine synthase